MKLKLKKNIKNVKKRKKNQKILAFLKIFKENSHIWQSLVKKLPFMDIIKREERNES